MNVFELIGGLEPPYNEQFVQPYIIHLVEIEHTDVCSLIFPPRIN